MKSLVALAFPIEIPENRKNGQNSGIFHQTYEQIVKLKQLIHARSLDARIRGSKWQSIAETTLCSSPSVAAPNFQKLSNADLFNLFELIDGQFFDGRVRDHLRHHKHDLSFRVSKKMTSSGGITTTRIPVQGNGKMEFEIAISATLLFASFQDKQPISVTGILCENRLQALMRIMEHEMIHLIEMLLWKDSSCNQQRFKNIAFRFFGHRQSTHQLLAPADHAARNFNFGVGDYVTFHRGTKLLRGFVNRITKRATILVPCETGVLYSDGQRYQKYYVPITKIRRSA